MRRILLLITVIALFSQTALAQSGHLKLLTVAESGDDRIGGTADLYLEIRKGSGRIFISSFPLTKLDTQISTRFANEIACQYTGADCRDYDFFYTIEAESTIIGGPSAGSGIAVLTAVLLKDLPMNDSVAVTGTINSGGVIGPVAGVPEKVRAAQEQGLSKVIIPRWASFNGSEVRNTSIEIYRASNLDDAVFGLTGQRLNRAGGEIEISEVYSNRMETVARLLCDRTDGMKDDLLEIQGNYTDENLTRMRNNAFDQEKYYSGASFCFSHNIDLREELLGHDSNYDKILKVRELSKQIGEFNAEIDNETLQTLSDLETYSIVKERIVDATENLKEINLGNISDRTLAYTIERYFSAVAWSQFFGLGGKAFTLKEEHLRTACIKKLSEAEERVDYVRTLSVTALQDTRKEIDLAYRDRSNGNYALCIFKAGKAKAEADMFLLGITIQEDDLTTVVDEKLAATKRVILDQQEEGTFPILGYSYYEYADSLKETNPRSALMFSEYSLEMSNLNLYFPEEEEEGFEMPDIDINLLTLFLSGLVLGFALGKIRFKRKKSKNLNDDFKTQEDPKGLPGKKR